MELSLATEQGKGQSIRMMINNYYNWLVFWDCRKWWESWKRRENKTTQNRNSHFHCSSYHSVVATTLAPPSTPSGTTFPGRLQHDYLLARDSDFQARSSITIAPSYQKLPFYLSSLNQNQTTPMNHATPSPHSTDSLALILLMLFLPTYPKQALSPIIIAN